MTTTHKLGLVVLCIASIAGFVLLGLQKRNTSAANSELVRFTEAKRAQVRGMVLEQNLRMPSASWQLFDAVLADDFARATNLFAHLERRRSATPNPARNSFQKASEWLQSKLEEAGLREPMSPGLESAAWQPLLETYWNYFELKNWRGSLRKTFVSDVLAAVPPGAIYFGGTDPGRFAITAALTSHTNGTPFFVITQNALADGTYLDYVRSMFSNHIYVPTPNDSQQAFETYLREAQRRLQSGQLKPGENVKISNNTVQVSGVPAVMEINALLVKTFFVNNPGRDFFIEQSWPLEWIYSHLIPHGPIFKINRVPLEKFSDAVLQADRRYWSNRCGTLIGNWITDKTTTQEICDFVEKVYVRLELNGFNGDPQYLLDRSSAQECFSKLRHATADLYLWRCSKATETATKQRMFDECLLAFHQAFALGPGNYEVVNDFTGVLAQISRFDDAERVLRVSTAVSPTNAVLMPLLQEKKAQSTPSK